MADEGTGLRGHGLPEVMSAGGIERSARGTAEQWIKECKYVVERARLSRRKFKDNQARVQLFALVYNLGT